MSEYGPPLPPGYQMPVDEEGSESEDDLPKEKGKFIGPQVPSFLSRNSEVDVNSSDTEESDSSKIIGPILPSSLSHLDNSNMKDDSEVYGPMPPQTNMDYDLVNMIEKRAANMRNKLENKDVSEVKKTEREEWMVVPDTSRRNQLGAISRCLAPGSSQVKRKEAEYHNPEEDKKITEALKKYNKKKRNESLLDMHSKKMKKEEKKSKKADQHERKPFDRDEMAVRHFTKDQVNSVIDKAKYLNSRFAPGKKQYL